MPVDREEKKGVFLLLLRTRWARRSISMSWPNAKPSCRVHGGASPPSSLSSSPKWETLTCAQAGCSAKTIRRHPSNADCSLRALREDSKDADRILKDLLDSDA